MIDSLLQITFTDNIQPVCLPPSSWNYQSSNVGAKALIAGWGTQSCEYSQQYYLLMYSL